MVLALLLPPKSERSREGDHGDEGTGRGACAGSSVRVRVVSAATAGGALRVRGGGAAAAGDAVRVRGGAASAGAGVLRGAEPLPGRDDPPERSLRRPYGDPSAADHVSGYPRPIPVRLLRLLRFVHRQVSRGSPPLGFVF